MKRLMNWTRQVGEQVKSVCNNQKGQTTTEYVVVLAVIAGMAVVVLGVLDTGLQAAIANVITAITTAIQRLVSGKFMRMDMH